MAKITFINYSGIELAASLEKPEAPTDTWAVFAHCFTCSKDFIAAARISRALRDKGIGVLRFDFTGLGNSQGDFANTNFSSNIDDLLAAVDFMNSNKRTVKLLIGHSLGGAAVIAAARQTGSVKAVVTIAAPSSPSNLKRHFVHKLDELESKGKVQIDIAGRKFTIKKQFIDDISSHKHQQSIAELNRPLLVYHSPMDKVVGMDDAMQIFNTASDPKSFISLDTADHLLLDKRDSEYVANTLTAWVERYL